MTTHADSHSFLEERALLRPGCFSQKNAYSSSRGDCCT
jgi:hypothetical protein